MSLSVHSARSAEFIHEQTVIVEYELEAAINGLAVMLPTANERTKALGVVEYIAGPIEEMEPQTIKMLQRFRHVLGLPLIQTTPSTIDPLMCTDTPDQANRAAAKALMP